MKSRIRKVFFVSGVALTLTGAVGFAPASRAGDFRRTPESSSQPSQEANLEELKELLRQAQELQQAQQKGGVVAPAKTASEQDAPDAKAEDDPEPEKKPEAVARPGCMYRDTTLIWEKVPGSCTP